MTLKRILYLFTLLLFAACAESNEPWPDYRHELADLKTDATGCVTALELDNGNTLPVTNLVGGFKPDTIQRVQALYTQGDNGAYLSDYAPILVTGIAKYADERIKTDPLGLIACWRGRNYINLRLALKGTERHAHYFAFHQTDFQHHANGTRTLCAILLHDQNSDPLYYTREVYLSIPLRKLDTLLRPDVDSVKLTIQTFDGKSTHLFAFQ